MVMDASQRSALLPLVAKLLRLGKVGFCFADHANAFLSGPQSLSVNEGECRH